MKQKLAIFVAMAVCLVSSPYVEYTATQVLGCPGGVCLVSAGGDLQAALNMAKGGDMIKLELRAKWVGHFQLPVHSGNDFVNVEPNGPLPPVLNTIAECNPSLGPTRDAELARKAVCKAKLIALYDNAPKIFTDNTESALSSRSGADGWRFRGIEFGSDHTVGGDCAPTYAIVAFGLRMESDGLGVERVEDIPDRIEFDRVYGHGNKTGCVRRFILGNATNLKLENSVCTEIHETGQDSQCLMAYNTNGPIDVHNNFLEAAGENLLFGGADPIQGLRPRIKVSRNYMSKDPNWWQFASRIGFTGYAGTNWQAKNVFECKNCEGDAWHNVLEMSWEYNQNGGIVLHQSLNDGGRCLLCTVKDLRMWDNIVRHGGQGLVLAGRTGQNGGATMGGNIWYMNILQYGIDTLYSYTGRGWAEAFRFTSGSNGPVGTPPFSGVHVRAVTSINQGGAAAVFGNCGDIYDDFEHTDNIQFADGRDESGPWYDAAWSMCGAGSGLNALRIYMPNKNYLVTRNVFGTDGNQSAWPAGNIFLKVADLKSQFMDFSKMDYRMKPGTPYSGLGVDFSRLPIGTTPANPVPPSGNPKPWPDPDPTAPVPEPPTPVPPPPVVCTYTLTPGSLTFPATGGSTTLTVVATPATDCSSTVSAPPDWLKRLYGSPGALTVTALPNSGSARSFTFTVGTGASAGALLVSQAASAPPVPPCTTRTVVLTVTNGNSATNAQWDAFIAARQKEGYEFIGAISPTRGVFQQGCE